MTSRLLARTGYEKHMSDSRKPRPTADTDLIARVRAAVRQEQFLEVVLTEEARVRFAGVMDSGFAVFGGAPE
jgi:hypothetical protein